MSIQPMILIRLSRFEELTRVAKSHQESLAGAGLDSAKLAAQHVLDDQAKLRLVDSVNPTPPQFQPNKPEVVIEQQSVQKVDEDSPFHMLLDWVRPSVKKKASNFLQFLTQHDLLRYRPSTKSYLLDKRLITISQLKHLFQFTYRPKASRMQIPLAASILKKIVESRSLQSDVLNQYYKMATANVRSSDDMERHGPAKWYELE